MKTKIIYISGNEVFDMHDIRAAFEEVRCALNLDKETVLFGVPVDADDACIMNNETPKETAPVAEDKIEPVEEPTPIIEEEIIEEETIPETPVIEDEVVTEEEQPTPKKRGRPRKVAYVEDEVEEHPTDEPVEQVEEKTVPILSVLSAKEEPAATESVDEDIKEDVEIISEITDEKVEDIVPEEITEPIEESVEEDAEPDLEKLLSEMTPLQEDIVEEKIEEPVMEESEPDLSVDATLEQLASEFVSSQDKIASETKPQSRSKIGKLRNILPFKQSKHKDQGIGDLLEWAGIAANDEDFSVPGFFTNAASRK